MSVWVWGALAMAVSIIICAIATLRGTVPDRLVGLELASILFAQLFALLMLAYGKTQFLDVAIATALLAFGGGLVFVRFWERWL